MLLLGFFFCPIRTVLHVNLRVMQRYKSDHKHKLSSVWGLRFNATKAPGGQITLTLALCFPSDCQTFPSCSPAAEGAPASLHAKGRGSVCVVRVCLLP